jgi:hypothetical protein
MRTGGLATHDRLFRKCLGEHDELVHPGGDGDFRGLISSKPRGEGRMNAQKPKHRVNPPAPLLLNRTQTATAGTRPSLRDESASLIEIKFRLRARASSSISSKTPPAGIPQTITTVALSGRPPPSFWSRKALGSKAHLRHLKIENNQMRQFVGKVLLRN